MENRAILLFENGMKTEATKICYYYWLRRFKSHFHLKDYDSILTIESKKLQEMLEDFLFHIKKRYSRSSIENAFFGLELFFSMNDVILNFKKIRKMFPAQEKLSGDEAYTTEDVRKILDCCKSRKAKALVHFLACSGSRVGGLEDLKIKDLSGMSMGCKSVLIYAGSIAEYWTFLTPEASKSLNDYFEERKKNGEYLDSNSPVFRTEFNKVGLGKAYSMSNQAIRSILYRAVRHANLPNRKRDEKNRYNKQIAHAFRKRFNTILKSNNDVNSNLAEKMTGHSITIPLDNTYLKAPKDRLFKEYVKAIPDLTIDEAIRLKEQNRLQHKRIKKLESDKDRRIDKLEKSLLEIKQHLKSARS